MKRVLLCLALLALLAAPAGPAAAWVSPAPDIVLYCTPAMQGALGQIVARYTARTAVAVHVFVAPPDGLIGLLRHRARDDVVVADTITLETMAAANLVRPETRVTLGVDPYVLVGAGATLPPGRTAAQLVASHATVLTDPTSAASFDGRAVLQAAVPQLSPWTITGVADTPTVIAALRRDPTLLGLVNATEAGGAGLVRAATLAAPAVPIGAALVTLGQSGKAADLLAFIAGPDGATLLHAAGLEPPS